MVGYWEIFVKRKFAIYSFIIVALGLLIYLPALSAGFVLDDEGQIVNNEIIKSFSNIHLFFKGGTFYGGDAKQLIGGFYRPIMSVVYSSIYTVAQLNPLPYHLFSVLLHCSNAILTFIFLRWLLKKETSPTHDLLPFLLSLIFLAHPMLVSGVAYVAAVNEPLFFFFGMSGLLLLIHKPFTVYTLLGSMLLFFLGLLSKETTLLFMGITYIYIHLFNRKKTLVFVVSSLLVMAVYTSMRCGVAHMCDGRTGIGPLALMSLDKYIIHLPAIIFFYLYTFVLPIQLAISQEWIIREATFTNVYLPLLADVSVAIASIVLLFYFYYKATNDKLLNHKTNANADRVPKTFVIALSMLILGLLMHAHIIPLDFTVDEHWFYFSIVGLIGMIGIVIQQFFYEKPYRSRVQLFLVIVVVLFAARTYIRTYDWFDNYRLFSHDIRVSTDSAALYNNLATELFRKKKYSEAKKYYISSTKIDPERPVAWTNLGIIEELEHAYPQAEKHYLTAISKGKYYKAYELYASVLIKQGKKDKAAKFLKEKAIPLFPHNQTLQALYASALL
ncbi:MAG: hypothetical protein RI947_756 [Candidatus Parcubacteria bacterium]|jgi:hypothetical protein